MKIINLHCEYRSNPLGIDIVSPRFSWQLEAAHRGARQTAFQVACYPSKPGSTSKSDVGENALWDTGKVISDQSTHLPYSGPSLQSRQRVTWRVRVWDEGDRLTDWSESAWFEMGLLSPGDWDAEWIGSSIVGGPYTTAPCPYFRKAFNTSSEVTAARLYITALGLYEAFINGQRIGENVFSPGWTDYAQRVQYQVYDVIEFLENGSNTLGVVLGDGWYCGYVGWCSRQLYGDRPKFLAQLEISFADGSRQIITTDPTWETARGSLLESDLMMGEAYDARLELPGWCLPPSDEDTSGGWLPVLTFAQPDGLSLVAQNGPGVRVHGELVPVSDPINLRGWPTATWILDFGQNLVGRVRLKVNGKRGSTIRLRFAEVLDEEGNLYTENLRSARQTDYYTLKGDPGGEVYESHFTFHGFRYVEISGLSGEPNLDTLTGIVLHSENLNSLEFECSDPLVNQLHQNILWGWKGNSVDVPTDCPQRDERLGWTGDAQVFVKTATYITDSAGFFNKWVQDLADAQLDTGAIPSVAPVIPDVRIFDGGAAWSDAFIIVPWTIWQQYGDTRILDTHYDAMCRYMDYLVENSPGYIRLLPSKKELGEPDDESQVGGYGDWLALDNGNTRRGRTPKDLIGTAFLAYDARLMSQMAEALGRSEDAVRFTNIFNSSRDAFIKRFITPGGLLVGGTQTGYVLALHFDLLPDHLRPGFIASLVKDIEVTQNGHMSTGFVGTPYICQVLTEAGRVDQAYNLLLQQTFPSWLYSVLNGATTIWERWDGWTEEAGFQDPGMNSFNHYAFGAIGTWMVENITGIRTDPGRPGFKHIILEPRLGGDLTWARGVFLSPYGIVKSQWAIRDGVFIWDVSIPPNTTATAFVPADAEALITESDRSIDESPGVELLERTEKSAVFNLLSGGYKFEVNSFRDQIV
jgi:alpha-L-rhamnosidase